MRDKQLSTIRVVAMLYVVYILHFFPHIFQSGALHIIGEMFSFIGVPTFFLLSGLLGGLFSHKYRSSWKSFFGNKVKRILIPYWIVLVAVIVGRQIQGEHAGVMEYVISVLNLQGIFQLRWAFPEMGHTWFISIIMVSYILTPLFVLFCDNRRGNRNKANIMISAVFLFAIAAFSMADKLTSAVYTSEIFLYYIGFRQGRGVLDEEESKGRFDLHLMVNKLVDKVHACILFGPWGG